MHRFAWPLLMIVWIARTANAAAQDDDSRTVRVFIFAGQSNMVGSDSHIEDIDRFPPFAGLGAAQPDVRFSYCIGREDKLISDGWVSLQPVDNVVGPELSFARQMTRQIAAPIAIIKIAAGGTHLGGDWNPDEPTGFKMYPLALDHVRRALSALREQGVPFRLEGFMWHQGENDMFDENYRTSYGKNLANFIASWRRDLNAPQLRFYIGELCTKTIWGMDLRPWMYAISLGQREVTDADPLSDYVPTSHVGVEIGGGTGLHYHYGTLGQLEHGVAYARACLTNTGHWNPSPRALPAWPYAAKSKVRLFILTGHRNMEGERAFVGDLPQNGHGTALIRDNPAVAYRYNLGGGYAVSAGWEPLGPTGICETFGPELSFSSALVDAGVQNFAIAKFTHSGSQMIDWTPAGSEAVSRNLFPEFLEFVRDSIRDLEQRGHEVELAGIFHHLSENDMSWGPSRSEAAGRLAATIAASRQELNRPDLMWFVSQQRPTDHESVNQIDVTGEIERLSALDPHWVHIKAFDPPPQREQLVLDARGIVWLGEQLAGAYVNQHLDAQ